MRNVGTETSVIEKVEIDLLLEGIYRVYGYDFRLYASSSIQRRLHHFMGIERLDTVSQLQHLVLHDPEAMGRLANDLSIPVTEMFRDPEFFHALRKYIVQTLKPLKSFRIWHAGCSTGEEAYSMAILLREEGLESRATIYATDMNERLLSQAREGVFPIGRMQQYTQNYLRAGGRSPFSDYYSIVDDVVQFDPTLRRSLVFAQHNLATDQSFNEFQLILCRNVLIYFNPELQRRVLRLFRESMVTGGMLALGNKEAVMNNDSWEELDPMYRWYRAI
ncbi:protein-glutamate O-methyltransferase CheR [Paenibacillus sp. TRM 82003]|nr:protein-glutamate O-methyltransferase CheR [Paenibacillus sp. TRM 82003]